MNNRPFLPTVVFDLDGTLLDTLTDLAHSVNHALRTYELPERTTDQVRRALGNGVRVLVRQSVPPRTPESLYEDVFKAFRTHYMAHCLDHTRPYAGIPALLTRLHAEGHPLAIVSNKLQPAVEELSERFFSDTIQVAIGESTDVRRKPAPDTVLQALAKLGSTPQDTVYVGDSEVDILTAQNVGVPCISVLWGFRDAEWLREHGARTLAAQPSDILTLLPQLFPAR